jgi:hypothetical protein
MIIVPVTFRDSYDIRRFFGDGMKLKSLTGGSGRKE